MIFAPVAIAGAGIFCVLTRYCARNCCDDSSEETTDDCCCDCSRLLEPRINDEELSIPLSPRSVVPFYSSTSIVNFSISPIFNGSNNAYETESESNLELVGFQNEEVVDSQILLAVDPMENSITLPSASPPDLLLMKGEEALNGYTAFLKNTAKIAQGPNVVHADYNDIKSKAFTKSFDSKESSDDESTLMDDKDAEYSEKYEKFLENNKIRVRAQSIDRSNSNEKKVQFYGIADVRSFKMDR